VAMHRDLTIAVTEKQDVAGYGPWSVKPGQFAVQPPLPLLRDNFTIRIHLDDTTADNGALSVVPGSHKSEYTTHQSIDTVNRVYCPVGKGGIMLMRPMLLHASGRTVNGQPRRVVHIEFSRTTLPYPLQWAEKTELK
jgi:ectoine hydroxylase-related dioxygenase (phytanoyl-CoA dioxygenase family)